MRTRRALAAFSVLTLALLAISASVSAAGQTIIHIPADQPTIQAGIDAAHNGDTVLVSPGTYYENIDFKGKAITVTSSGGSAVTTIDGRGLDATVTFKSGEVRNSVISNVTIRNGGYAANTQGYAGGGVYVSNSAPTILGNIITANANHCIQVEFGAALIEANELNGTLGSGGTFFDGSAVILSGNSQLQGLPNSILIGNVVENNLHAHEYDGGGIGLWAVEGTVIQNNIIRNNATTGTGGAIVSFNTDRLYIVDNLIYGNSANAAGLNSSGGVSLFPPEATQGPFIGIIAGNTISGNTINPANSISDEIGEQVSLEGNLGQYLMVNNIVIGTSSSLPAVNCGEAYNYLSVTPLVFDHNDIYNPNGPAYGGACPDQTGAYGNISADPMFLNPAGGNFQLSISSSAVDAGNNAAPQMPTTDIAGNSRIQDATSKGYPIIDMGAYEHTGAQDGAATVLSLSPSAYQINGGSPLTLSAKLFSTAGVPTGSVTFFEDDNQIGSGLIDATGAALYTLPSALPGLHAFLATYPGQGVFSSAVSVKFYVLVDKYGVTLKITSSQNPSILGQPVTFTITESSPDNAALSPITLTDGLTNTTLATLTPNSSGIATYTTSSLTLGTHPINAAYAGDALHNSTSATVFQQVLAGYSTTTSLASSLNPAPYGQSITFTATITNTSTNPAAPTGSVVFSDGSTILGTQSVTASGANSATAIYSTSSLSVGTHPITATYTPSGSFAGSTGSLSQVITGFATSTSLTSSPNPANVTQSVTFTATVSTSTSVPGGLTGSVMFYDGATLLTNAPIVSGGSNSGTASFSTSSLTAGVHTITATFNSLAAFSTSSAQLTQTINKLASTTALTGTPNPALFGTAVTFTATVAGSLGTPTGTVTFYDGSTVISTGPVGVNGQINPFASNLAVGTHTITAVYAGDSIYAASTSAPFIEVIQPLPQDFSITLASPSITIKTQHHTTTTLTLTSINGFADSLAITCANLPQYVTCQPKPTPASLPANGSATVSLYLDTDSVLGYARLAAPARPTPAPSGNRSAPIALALLFAPFSFFSALALSRKSRRAHFCTPLRLLALLLALLPISAALSGCTTIIDAYDPPAAAVPGTYTIPITAAGAATHVAHTTNLTLIITP